MSGLNKNRGFKMDKTADIIETAEMFEPEEIMVTDEVPVTDFVIIEEPVAPVKTSGDYDKTQDLADFMEWITKKINNLPPHSGKTTAGCERVIAHLKMLDKEISKAIARDTECVLDDQAVEKFRKDIRKMVKKLEKRLKEINDAYDADDKKYASNENDALLKEAEAHACGCQIEKTANTNSMYCKRCGEQVADKKAAKNHVAVKHPGEDIAFSDLPPVRASEIEDCPTCKIQLWKAAEGLYECIACDAVFKGSITKEAGTARIQLVITPLERALTGILINGYVSQGKQIEAAFAELKKAYNLTEREELSIMQLLLDMGYPAARNLVGMPHKNDVEFAVNYQV